MRSVSNLQDGRRELAVWLILPALLAIVVLAGVSYQPVREAFALRGTCSLAPELSAGLAEAERKDRAFEAERARESLDAALAQARLAFPRGVSPLELHAIVRLIADALGFALETVVVQDATDAGLAVLDDVLFGRPVVLRGGGPIDSVERLDAALAAIGFRVSASKFQAHRADSGTDRFQIQAEIIFYESTEPVDSAASGLPGIESMPEGAPTQ